MGHEKDRSRGVARKKKLTVRLKALIILLGVTGLLSIVYLASSLGRITLKYSEIVNEDYQNIDYMSSLSKCLYKHQNLVMEHLITTSQTKKSTLDDEIRSVESALYSTLEKFGNDITGDQYESYYHSIYSGIRGYMKNVDIIFELSNRNETETAAYYLERTLVEYISTVNGYLDEFNIIMLDDLETAKSKLETDTIIINLSAIILIIILVVISMICHMISERIADEMVNKDAVTGISNYEHFIEYGEKKAKSLSDFSVLNLDIKGFQYYNQQLGTGIGDLILKEYAKYIGQFFGKNELAARINGDNFIALIKKDRVSSFLEYIENIIFELDINDEYQKITICSRCGIYPVESGVSISAAAGNSAAALKMAKDAASSDHVWYTPEMSENAVAASETIAHFRKALKDREFVVYYQPKVDMRTKKLCGSEALVRWISKGNIIPPFRFIPVLERDGSITELDFYVFENVCRDISEWIIKGISPVRTSSNFSKLHLKNKSFADDILKIINKYGVDPKYIEIELTESSGNEDFEAMTDFVKRMKKAGIHTAVDDFGTGYSSLSMLRDLDMDVIKLDKSFLNSAKEPAQKKMIENVIKMINDLDRSVICEGVETEEQVDFLLSVHCYTAQGYHYDKPLPHDEFEKRLRKPVYTKK